MRLSPGMNSRAVNCRGWLTNSQPPLKNERHTNRWSDDPRLKPLAQQKLCARSTALGHGRSTLSARALQHDQPATAPPTGDGNPTEPKQLTRRRATQHPTEHQHDPTGQGKRRKAHDHSRADSQEKKQNRST